MMDKTEFTAAVLAAEPTMYRVAKSMLQNEQDCLCSNSWSGFSPEE